MVTSEMHERLIDESERFVEENFANPTASERLMVMNAMLRGACVAVDCLNEHYKGNADGTQDL